MSVGAGLFFLAAGIAAAGFFVGCGLEECGDNIRKGLRVLAISLAEDDTFDPDDDE